MHAELVVLECGHWWPYERPQETAEALLRLWAAGGAHGAGIVEVHNPAPRARPRAGPWAYRAERMTDDLELLALHGLAVKKAGSAGRRWPPSSEPTRPRRSPGARRRRRRGPRDRREGHVHGHAAGREWLDERYPEAFADFRADPDATAAYERFERINRELLALFTDWQMMPAAGGERVPNDHSDADYDAGVIDRLGASTSARRRCSTLRRARAAAGRVHARRLEAAYDRVLAGETDYVSGARIDSYHTVWFELHEDLLRMLGPRARGGTVSAPRR